MTFCVFNCRIQKQVPKDAVGCLDCRALWFFCINWELGLIENQDWLRARINWGSALVEKQDQLRNKIDWESGTFCAQAALDAKAEQQGMLGWLHKASASTCTTQCVTMCDNVLTAMPQRRHTCWNFVVQNADTWSGDICNATEVGGDCFNVDCAVPLRQTVQTSLHRSITSIDQCQVSHLQTVCVDQSVMSHEGCRIQCCDEHTWRWEGSTMTVCRWLNPMKAAWHSIVMSTCEDAAASVC